MISMEDLEPLMGKPSSELMSSHVHKLMQVCVLLMRTFSFPFLFFFFIFLYFFYSSPICHCRCWESPCTSLESNWTIIRS